MSIAAIVFFVVAAVAAVTLVVLYLLSPKDIDMIRRADRVLNDLGRTLQTSQSDSIVARIERSIQPQIEAEAKPMTELMQRIGRQGKVTADEISRLRVHADELEKWNQRILAIRRESQVCALTAHNLLLTTTSLFSAMADLVRDEDSAAADNLSKQVGLLHECRRVLHSAPLPLTLVVISTLSRIEAINDAGNAERVRQINDLVERYKGSVRGGVAVDNIPASLIKFNKLNKKLLRAVGRCCSVIRGNSWSRRLVPTVQKIPRQYIPVLAELEKISSMLH